MSGPVTSSGKELLGSFPEEVTARPDTARSTSSGNELCSSLRRSQAVSAHVMNFSGNEPHSSFPEKSQA